MRAESSTTRTRVDRGERVGRRAGVSRVTVAIIGLGAKIRVGAPGRDPIIEAAAGWLRESVRKNAESAGETRDCAEETLRVDQNSRFLPSVWMTLRTMRQV